MPAVSTVASAFSATGNSMMNVAPLPYRLTGVMRATVFLDEAVAQAQAQAGAFADVFGGKEWIENARKMFLGMPGPLS